MIREWTDRLYRHLAVDDYAVVQGGLTTTMELAACKVPFIYVPLIIADEIEADVVGIEVVVLDEVACAVPVEAGSDVRHVRAGLFRVPCRPGRVPKRGVDPHATRNPAMTPRRGSRSRRRL